MNKPDTSPAARLTKALKYLELARISRELPYGSIPYVVAAEHLIKQALEQQVLPQLHQNWLEVEK